MTRPRPGGPAGAAISSAGAACVVPIMMRLTDRLGLPTGELRALPPEGKPVVLYEPPDVGWVEVARGLRRVIEAWPRCGMSLWFLCYGAPPMAPGGIHGRRLRSPARTARRLVLTAVLALEVTSARAHGQPPPTGLAHPRRLEACVRQGGRALRRWSKRTPEERANSLGQALKTCLTPLHLFMRQVELAPLSRFRQGEFAAKFWTLRLSRTDFLAEPLSFAAARRLLGTLMHEGRHGEQYFRVAQFLAARGKSPKEIVDELKIPTAVAMQASKHPLRRGTREFAEAERWCRSLCQSGPEHKSRNAALAALAEADAWLVWVERYVLSVFANPHASQPRRDHAYQLLLDAETARAAAYAAYRQLISEIDSFVVEYTVAFLDEALGQEMRR